MASAAVVRRGGKFEELDGSSGVALLQSRPDLASLAVAMTESDVTSARFLWVEAGMAWLMVELRLTRDLAENDDVVVVEIEEIKDPPYELTRRELDILTSLAAGFSNPEIGERLFISKRTVSTHLEKILRKLGQRSRAGAAALAIERGLLRLPLPATGEGFEHLSVGRLSRAAAGEKLLASPYPFGRTPDRAPLLIGLALPGATGDFDDADEMLNGSRLAISEINDRGGISGRRLQAVEVCVDIDSTKAIEDGIEELINQDVDAIAVSYSYAEDLSIYKKAAEYGCPVLTAMTSEAQAEWVQVNPSTLGSVFQVAPTERYYGIEFFRLLDSLKKSGEWTPSSGRVACIETEVASGQMMDPKAVELGHELGWTVDRVATVSNRSASWDEVLDYLETEQPAAVMIAHFVAEEVARFQRLFRERDSSALIYCIYAPSVPKFLDMAGADADGVLWSTATGTYGDDIGRGFAARYKTKFGREPGRSLAGIAYDQVNLLAEAWSRTGNPRSFPRVAKELRRVVHRGVNGVYSLGNARQTGLTYPFETQDPSVSQAHLVFQVQGGQHRIISPSTYAESRFIAPEWVSSLPVATR